jgi:serine protease
MTNVSIYDKVGNRKRLSQEDSVALGFPAEFEVASVGDSEPPEIVSLDFDPKAVDTSASSQDIRATVRLTDDLSGIDQGSIRFYSPSQSQSIGAWFSSYERISGTDLDGVYEHKMTLPRYSEPGTWNLDYISIYDKVGNRKRLSFEDAVSLGFPTEFEVASVGDFQPPNIVTFDFDPKDVDTSTISQEVTITARLTDDLSGVDQGGLRFYSPSRSQSVGAWFISFERISGDELDGIYRHKMTIPQYSEAGTWRLEYISIYDKVGNRKQLSYEEASALGFPTSFRNDIDKSPSPEGRIARWQRPLHQGR